MGRTTEYREIINMSEDVYKEEWKGGILEIPARAGTKGGPEGPIMPRREAVQFLAQYKPFDREQTTGEKPLSWKPANGKRPAKALEAEIEEPQKFVNEATGAEFATKAELDQSLKSLEHLAGVAKLKIKKDED